MLGHCRPAQRGWSPPPSARSSTPTAGRGARRASDGHRAARAGGAEGRRLLEDAEDDLLAFYAFPAAHWPKLRSTNPLERVNREIGRRSDVVGIFPNDASVIRLAGALLIEQNDEWLVGRRYLSVESMNLLDDTHDDAPEQEVIAELKAA